MRNDLMPLPGGYLIKPGTADPVETMSRRAHMLMEDDVRAYEVIYLPMAVAEVVWEFCSTVTDVLPILRDASLKSVTRELKRLPVEYRHHFQDIGMGEERLEGFGKWKETFLSQIHDGREVTRQIVKAMADCGINPDRDRKGLVAAAYVAWSFAEALSRYCQVHESRFAMLAGLPDYGRILPPSFYRMLPLMRRVIGRDALPSGIEEQIVFQMVDLYEQLAEEAGESPERYHHRTSCVAYRNNCGCRAQARRGPFGCYPSSRCKRMLKYDNLHQKSCTKD